MSEVPQFRGDDFVAERDQVRLTGQIRDLFELMKDGHRRMMSEVEEHFEGRYPHSSLTANFRNLRKPENGGYIGNKYHLGQGNYVYELLRRGVTPPPGSGFSQEIQDRLRSQIVMELGLKCLAAVREHIDNHDQMALRRAVREWATNHVSPTAGKAWYSRIQRLTEGNLK